MNPPSLDTIVAPDAKERMDARESSSGPSPTTDEVGENPTVVCQSDGNLAKPVVLQDSAVLARYRRPGRLFNPEFRVGLLGDLAGRQLLDVGCGTGNYTVLFAQLGAQVTGIDPDPTAIEAACRRAVAAGVADRCRLVRGPLDASSLAGQTFDIVWTDSLLHQHLAHLPQLVHQLVAWTRPGGLVVCGEPVNFAPWLRRLRNWLPVAVHGPHGDRPLSNDEIAVLRQHLPDLRLEPFHLISRLHRFVLTDHSYESSSAPRRWAAWGMSLFDAIAFRIPGVRSLAGTAAIYGHRP